MAERYDSIMRRCRDAAARVGRSRMELKEEMKLLGMDLIAARSMVRHGEWESVLSEYGIHVWTAKRAIRIAMGKADRKVPMALYGSGQPNGNGGDSGDNGRAVVEDDWDLPGAPGADFEDEEEEEGGEELGRHGHARGSGEQLGLSEMYQEMAAVRAQVMLRLDRLQSRGDAEALELMRAMARAGGGE